MTIINKSLDDALSDRKITVLPQEGTLDGGWKEAIVLVERAVGGIRSYAYATKTDSKINIVKDFGFAYQCSTIKAILKAYPLGIIANVAIEKQEEKKEETEKLPEQESATKEDEKVIEDNANDNSSQQEELSPAEIAMMAAENDNTHVKKEWAQSETKEEPENTKETTTGKKRGRPRKYPRP